jgi:YVTN family beta-propeller protein
MRMTWALVLLAAAVLVGAAEASAARPSAPTVSGSRSVDAGSPVSLRLAAVERGIAPSRLRFQCSFDSPRLHTCGPRIRVRLAAGRHLLRARAVDPRGRKGPLARFEITVRTAVPRAPSIPVGTSPVNIAFGSGSIWVSNNGNGTVSRVDPTSDRVVATVDVGGAPAGIAAGAGSVWVGNFGNSDLTRIDPSTNGVSGRLDLGGQPLGPAVAADGTVWVSNFDGSIERIPPAGDRAVARIVLGGKPAFTAIAFGLVWSVNQNGTVSTVDPATDAQSGAPVQVGDDVDDISAGPDAIWVTTYNDGLLARIDPSTRAVTWSKKLGGRAAGVLAASDGGVWVSLYDRGVVERIDPESGSVIRTVRVGLEPRQIVEAAGSLWVANQASGTVSHISL